MDITGKAFRGFSLLLSLVPLRAQSPDMALKIEVHNYNYSSVSAEALVRAEQETVPASKGKLPAHLCIHLYNLANVSPRNLDRAAEVAASIFATAAVDIVWQHGPADSPEARTFDETGYSNSQHPEPDVRNYLVATIRRGDPASVFPGALGFALPVAQRGVHAIIFYDRIEGLIQTVIVPLPEMLGHVMAHEIGHVLLGSTKHSSTGIMKARWDKTDFQYGPRGCMEFTPEERSVLRERVLVRASRVPE